MTLDDFDRIIAKPAPDFALPTMLRAETKVSKAPADVSDDELRMFAVYDKGFALTAYERREAARRQAATPAPVPKAATPAAKPVRLAPMPDPDQINSIEDFDRWVFAHGKQATPVLLWGIFLGLARERREKLEARIVTLEQKIAELDARPAAIDYRGTFAVDTPYTAGCAVTHHGSIWIARRLTTAAPGTPDCGWTLAVKKGRDARDLRRGKGMDDD